MSETSIDLEVKIDERMAFLEKVIAFAQLITLKRGRLVKNEVHSAHINTVRELEHFEGFTFKVDEGQSVMGGNTVTVRRGENGMRETVLVVYWQTSIAECRVEQFDHRDSEWQTALMSVIDRADSIAATADSASAEERRRIQERTEADRHVAQLKARAEQLRLI